MISTCHGRHTESTSRSCRGVFWCGAGGAKVFLLYTGRGRRFRQPGTVPGNAGNLRVHSRLLFFYTSPTLLNLGGCPVSYGLHTHIRLPVQCKTTQQEGLKIIQLQAKGHPYEEAVVHIELSKYGDEQRLGNAPRRRCHSGFDRCKRGESGSNLRRRPRS